MGLGGGRVGPWAPAFAGTSQTLNVRYALLRFAMVAGAPTGRCATTTVVEI